MIASGYSNMGNVMSSDCTITDTKLVADLCNGNAEAFSEIYRRYAEPIYLQLRKKIDCREEAKDIVQEIFASLWQKHKILPKDTCLSAYLFTAAKYRAINYIAHQKVSETALNDLSKRLHAEVLASDHLVRERDLSEVIETAVSDLPDKMQVIFRMSRQDQLSHKEIAQNLNLSETTVKKQVANALKILKPKISTKIITLFTAIYNLF